MLSPLESDLVRRDPELPGLATMLDPDAFAAALVPFLPGAGAATARLTYSRYKPRESCVVAYQLEVAGVTVDAYAKAHRSGAHAPAIPPRLQESQPIILQEGAISAYVFPADHKLKALRRLAGSATRRNMLRRLVRDRPDLWDGAVKSLRYMPEWRYVAQVLSGSRVSAAMKMYHERGYGRARANATAFRSNRPLRVATCLGQSAKWRTLLLEWLPGRLVSEAVADPASDPGVLETVGAALALVHLQEPADLAPLTRREEAATLSSLSANLGVLCPHLAARLDQVVGMLGTQLLQAPPVYRPIHGDFSPKQVVLRDGDAAVLDFDRAARGDPALDLGCFIAHLEQAAVAGALPVGRKDLFGEALLAGYRAASRGPIPPRVPLYVAVGLVRLTAEPFRFREPRWSERTEALLERIETQLRACGTQRA
jgi:aminoglycoside phosphotransferase (APT) family kinase protein